MSSSRSFPRLAHETAPGLVYGVTATSREEADRLLATFGYPLPGQRIIEVVEGVKHADLDQHPVVPNAGPIVFRSVWCPMHHL